MNHVHIVLFILEPVIIEQANKSTYATMYLFTENISNCRDICIEA